jgi:predicted MPP superfamily phosphohydrolase
MDLESQKKLQERLGNDQFGRRMLIQANKTAERLSGGKKNFYWEHAEGIHKALTLALKLTGLTEWAKANTMQFNVVENRVGLTRLPVAFEGYRILHLSDLHIDHIPDKGEKLVELINDLDFDLCVLHTDGTDDDAVDRLLTLLPALQGVDGVIGVLGNHDYLEMVIALEELGVDMLLNESKIIQRGEDSLCLIGVDDPHYYQADDLLRALSGVQKDDFKVLLVHSPEIISKAADMNIDFYLCGHTHGGQVCLPGGIPLMTNARCARKFASGAWQYQLMQGYTSRGVGASGVDARVFCPPEIIIHELFRSG